jgi:predicted nuclease of restriction endonuclease-like (RecB) superfamily
MLSRGQRERPEDRIAPEEEIKDPLVLEFLGLKDEYSEAALKEALILRLGTGFGEGNWPLTTGSTSRATPCGFPWK